MSRVESFPADSFLAASGSGLHLLRRWPLPPPKEGGAPPPPAPRGCGEPAFDEVTVSHDAEYTAAEWNRNNRVVAAGSADGTVQLRYACGTMMYMLPREGAAPYGGAITALSWSAGSKRLAAGCATGDVHIHDIQTKVCEGQRIIGVGRGWRCWTSSPARMRTRHTRNPRSPMSPLCPAPHAHAPLPFLSRRAPLRWAGTWVA